jgi:hypothetical protein
MVWSPASHAWRRGYLHTPGNPALFHHSAGRPKTLNRCRALWKQFNYESSCVSACCNMARIHAQVVAILLHTKLGC